MGKSLPYHKGPQSQRERCWRFIHSQGEYGATADEVNIALGIAHGCTIRVTELYRLGRVDRLEGKRRTRTGRKANVHVAVPPDKWADKREGWPTPTKAERSMELQTWKNRALLAEATCLELQEKIQQQEENQ